MTLLITTLAFVAYMTVGQIVRNRAQSRRYEHMLVRMIELERR